MLPWAYSYSVSLCREKSSGSTVTVKKQTNKQTLQLDLCLRIPTCFRTHRCWLLPSRRLLLLGSAAVPPTATWLCGAPPTGGRVSLLLFPTPTERQTTRSPRTHRGCVREFSSYLKNRFLQFRPSRRPKDFGAKCERRAENQTGARRPRLHPSSSISVASLFLRCLCAFTRQPALSHPEYSK